MKLRILLLLMLFLAACTSQPGPVDSPTVPPDTAVTSPPEDMPTNEPDADPLAPKPGDADLTRGNVFINEMGLLIRESYPPQIALTISGDLPTPCHELRVVVSEPDAENKINVEAYTVTDPDMVCTQVLSSFQQQIELGSFPAGHYTVWVNGELAGEFDS